MDDIIIVLAFQTLSTTTADFSDLLVLIPNESLENRGKLKGKGLTEMEKNSSAFLTIIFFIRPWICSLYHHPEKEE
jgi:hypothetical protein